jgi:gliding motility-associated-like protein
LGVAGSFGVLTNCTNIDTNFAAYSIFYTQNTTNTYEYDGRTVVLEAKAAVVCGETYHIKLAIGDAGDGSYDSGVFIEGGSFKSDEVLVDIVTTTGDSAIVEGCNSAQINFIRPSTSDSLVVHFSLMGSTAINGVDFVTIVDSVTFLPGSDTVSVVIIPIADGITEGIEVITITAITFNACGDTLISTGNIYIIDVPEMHTLAPDTTLYCAQDSIYIWAQGSNATPPYSYEWFDSQGNPLGIDSNYAFVPGSANDTFYVDITDSCNSLTLRDTVIVSLLFSPLEVNLHPDTNICAGDSVLISATVSGGIPPYTFQWSNGLVGVDTFWVTPMVNSVYSITVSDSCNSVVVTDSVVISTDKIPMTLILSNDTLVCKNQSITLLAVPSGGIPPYLYQWSPITSNLPNPSVTPSTTTQYFVSVTDQCQDTLLTDSVLINTEFPPLVLTTSEIGEVCSGDVVAVEGEASGGKPPYSVYWRYGEQESFALNFEFVADYTLSDSVKFFVVDACLESDSLSVDMVVNDCRLEFPNVFTPNGDGENDVFHIKGLEYYPSNTMRIYNRWGGLIFEMENYRNTWDGYSPSGQALPEGVYFYVLDVFDTENSHYQGTITLLK